MCGIGNLTQLGAIGAMGSLGLPRAPLFGALGALLDKKASPSPAATATAASPGQPQKAPATNPSKFASLFSSGPGGSPMLSMGGIGLASRLLGS